MSSDWELRARLQAEQSRSSALATALAALGLQGELERGEWTREWEDRERTLREEIVRLREAVAQGNEAKEDNKRLKIELETIQKGTNLNSGSWSGTDRCEFSLCEDKENEQKAAGQKRASKETEISQLKAHCYDLVSTFTGLRAKNEALHEQITLQQAQSSAQLLTALNEAASLRISLQIAKSDQLHAEEMLSQVQETAQNRIFALERQIKEMKTACDSQQLVSKPKSSFFSHFKR